MGTISASSYAHIFKSKFELNLVYLYVKGKTLIYLRYTDDLIFIWKETKGKSLAFFGTINKAQLSIKFD